MMFKTWMVAIALLVVSAVSLASEPVYKYHWSVTGERYSLVNTTLRNDVFGIRNLRFDAVAGVESRRNIPAFGAGLSYRLTDDVIVVDAGAYVLNRTNPTTDVTFGISFGIRF